MTTPVLIGIDAGRRVDHPARPCRGRRLTAKISFTPATSMPRRSASPPPPIAAELHSLPAAIAGESAVLLWRGGLRSARQCVEGGGVCAISPPPLPLKASTESSPVILLLPPPPYPGHLAFR